MCIVLTYVTVVFVPFLGTQANIHITIMAEAAAVVGFVASIASLIDLSAKVVSRLHEFTSKVSDVPRSFRSLRARLPLLTTTLQRIQSQTEAGHLLDDITKALKALVDDTFKQVLAVHTCLFKILPSDGASKLKRVLRALKSLAKEDKIQEAMERIDQNSLSLAFHLTTQNVETGDLILSQLTELNMISKSASKSVGKDKLLSLARPTGRITLEELPLQTQLILPNSSQELLFRFSQLPVAAQERFKVQQEKQLSQFVE